MKRTIEGVSYDFVRVGDLQRDGMALEVWGTEEDSLLAEVFFSDATQEFTFSGFRQDLPLALVEALIAAARSDLPPLPGEGGGAAS